MIDHALLPRMARLLKRDIAPAVGEEYARTQAFMAAVVTEKLGRQLELAQQHEQASDLDVKSLLEDLKPDLDAVDGAPGIAWTALQRERSDAALCELIAALYAARNQLGDSRFERVLARIRAHLRAAIDRRMEYAR